MELAFAGLHQLCAPMLDRRERLPGPQRDALGVVFGLSGGEAPDRFVVALAVLSLLSDVAQERPLVCPIDDAQWLDRESAQALAFVARRLVAESVVMVFAAREPGRELAGLPDLVIEGLPGADARALLGTVIRGPLDARVRDRIVAETRGNPLALLELPRGASAADLAGGFGLPSALPLSSDRGEFPAAAGGAAGRQPAAVAARRGGPDRRAGAGVARGRETRDRAGGGGACSDSRPARVRCSGGAVSSSAGALRGLPCRAG